MWWSQRGCEWHDGALHPGLVRLHALAHTHRNMWPQWLREHTSVARYTHIIPLLYIIWNAACFDRCLLLGVLCSSSKSRQFHKISQILQNIFFVPQSVWRQVHSHFQREFSTLCDIVLPLSVYSILSFLRFIQYLLTSSSLSFLHLYSSSYLPSIMCFRRQFLRKMWPIQLAFFLFTVCMIFLSSLTLSNTSSFLTQSVQLIFSILLQHHISKLSRYFWSTFQSVQVSAPYSSVLQM